jgi:hypothetical protein
MVNYLVSSDSLENETIHFNGSLSQTGLKFGKISAQVGSVVYKYNYIDNYSYNLKTYTYIIIRPTLHGTLSGNLFFRLFSLL